MTISPALPDVKATSCGPRFALLTVLNVMHSTQLSWTDIGFPVYRLLVHRLAYSGDVAAGQLAVFQGASEAPIPPHFCLLLVWPFRSRRKNGAGRVERATGKNSQPAAARRVAFKMGRRPRCSSVTYRFRYAPSSRLADGPSLYARRCTRADGYSSGPIHQIWRKNDLCMSAFENIRPTQPRQ